MDHWDELRTALEVARQGTVSGAAQALGVHHATVIRHIDALEGRLGVKLFQRHARGYTATEAGEELARVARASDDQFAQLAARLSGQGAQVAGDLVVTTLASLSATLLPVLRDFRDAHPSVRLTLRTGTRLFRLEYGEAHVAIRAGNAPQEPDNVVQPLADLQMGLYAAPEYLTRYGHPGARLETAWFVGPDKGTGAPPFLRWMREHVAPEQVAFRSDDDFVLGQAVRAGLGVGFLPVREAEGLVEVAAPQPEWRARLWLVTHVDLHRSAKVQALTRHLKAAIC